MGALGRCPSTAQERGDSRERERFLLGTNTFQVEGTAAHWAGPTVWQALAQDMDTHDISPS